MPDDQGVDHSEVLDGVRRQWQVSEHDGVRHFLNNASEITLRRSNLAATRCQFIRCLSDSLPFSTEIKEHWAQTFDRFLRLKDLQNADIVCPTPRPPIKHKPGV